MPVSFSENDWFTVCVRRELKVVLLLFRTCPYDYESSVYLDIFSMIVSMVCIIEICARTNVNWIA